jgi:uncharacterized membrane protein SpoIIM required for sporulation/ABC-type transport system involved in multi-copper enzyme maturation permease subunit
MKRKDLRLTWLVARRELVDQLRDWRILMPMFILILFFPYLMNYAAFQAVNFIETYGDFELIAERIVPFFLMVVGFFPITVSLIVALESFVGEKERGTIEPMLSSPLADWHMYLGKLIAGSLVPLAASYISMGLYMIGLVIQRLPFPPFDLLIQMLLLTMVQAVLMVSGAMIISTQATSVRAANLLASFIVIPVGLLIQGESVLIFWGNNQVLWLAVLGVILVTALLIRLGLAHFQREVLLGREIDVLNLRLMGGLFWKSFSGTGQAPLCLRWLSSAAMRAENSLSKALLGDLRGFFGWYTGWVFPLLRKMRTAIFIVVLIGLMTSGVAFWFVTANFSTSGMGEERVDEVSARIGDLLLDGQQVPLEITSSWLFLNNSRVALVILFLGMFSFGVAGVLVYILNLSLVGAVLGAVEVVGLSWLDVLVLGILPHGIFELPAIVLVSAGVLYMGTRLVTPNPKESIGEVVIETLAEWMVIAIGLAFPLLLIAALVEANITPILLYNLFENSFFAGS